MGDSGTGFGGNHALNNVSAAAKGKHVKDVFANAGMHITDAEARFIASSVERWSGNDHATIRLMQRWEADNGRELPTTSNAYQYKVAGDNVEKYIAVAPKVSGTLYRGVSTKVTKHSPIESWTTDKSTAQAFGSRVLTATVNVKDVLFSHKTMKGWNEADVVGKEEVAVLGSAFK